MAYRKKMTEVEKRDAAPDLAPPDTMHYSGFHPQGYVRPNTPHVNPTLNAEFNNQDRGEYPHGREENRHTGFPHDGQKHPDHYPAVSDDVALIYPEQDEDIPAPLPVKVVEENDEENIVPVVDSYPVSFANGPVRILGKDRHRYKATIGTVGTGVGTPVFITRNDGLPAYGFPVGAAVTAPYVTAITEELWVACTTAGDSATIAVIVERHVQADAGKN